MLGDCWGPRSSLESYTLDEMWASYNTGEKVFNKDGIQIGIKPPLRQVEQYFKSGWRKTDKVSNNCVNTSLVISDYLSYFSNGKRGSASVKSPTTLNLNQLLEVFLPVLSWTS